MFNEADTRAQLIDPQMFLRQVSGILVCELLSQNQTSNII